MKIKIRKFRKEDAIKTSNVIKRTQRVTLGKVYPKRLIEDFCQRNNPNNLKKKAKEINYFVAETKPGKILGIIGVKENFIRTFYVDPAYHGKGIGRKLFERAKKEILKHGHRIIFTNSSIYACPIYKRFGFKFVKKVRKEKAGIKYYDILMKSRL